MNQYKLKPAAKIMILVVVAAIIAGTVFGLSKLPFFKDVTKGKVKAETVKEVPAGDNTIRLSLDEWIGWSPLVSAVNDGTFEKLGVKVVISVINDGSKSSDALIGGSLDAAGYTVNRYAFLYNKFIDAGVPVKMPFIVNSSTGGDGIIAKKGINRIEDLVGKKIGVPRFSEAQTLIEWLLGNSSLTEKQVTDIRKNMVMFDTPDQAASAFFAGQIDAAATWQPYLAQAQETSNAHVLFSTKSATNLILDGVVFRKDFLDSHKDLVAKFIKGVLIAQSKYAIDTASIKDVFPMFSTMSDADILATTPDATQTNYATNVELLKGTAQTLFKDMSNIWSLLGEKASPSESLAAFDATVLEMISGDFADSTTTKPKFTEADRKTAASTSNDEALITQNLTINFESGAATIKSDSYEALNKFAETAGLLNNVVIQIEGNTDADGNAAKNVELSEKRAKSVATYLKFQGVDQTRFVIVGNGSNNPIADNDSANGKAANRRTDIFFKAKN